jgi:hypothetical protein
MVPLRQLRVIQAGIDNQLLTSLRRLSDVELVASLKTVAARARIATSELVAHLAEFDLRGIHLREGYGSLFAYCREALSLSEHEAYNRIEVARAARRFPVILEMLAEGAVSLTSVRLLAPHLTPENHGSVLASARGKRKVDIEEIVARLAPRPDVGAKVRKLPTPRDVHRTSSLGAPSRPPLVPVAATPQATVAAPVLSTRSAPVVPLADDRYKLQMTIGGDTLRKLRLAKDMLRHALPTGDDAAILDRALTALLTELARERFGAAERPRPGREASATSRHIPAAVKRTVWIRDLGACNFRGPDGRRCGERAFIQFHHVRPFAVGGEPTASNVELRCGRHNRYEAKVFFATPELFWNEAPASQRGSEQRPG